MATILETERLTLRHLEDSDLNDLFRMYRDPEVRQFFPEGTLTLEETRAELDWHRHGDRRRPELGLWATVLKADGTLIGRCGLLPWTLDGVDEVEVAYLINRPWWGRGLATEAAMAIRDYGFEALHLARLVSLIDGENIASKRVAEHIGMRFERLGEDELGPFELYAMTRDDRNSTGSHA